MSCKPQSILWAIGLNLLVAGWAWALPLTEYNKLKDVVVEDTPQGLHIQIQFREPPINYETPVFFKNSVQVDLPFAYLAPAKQYYPTGNEEVRQVYASQFNKELLRIRFILGDPHGNLAGRFQLKRNGNNLDVLVRPAGAVGDKDRLTPEPKEKFEDPLDEFLASTDSSSKAQTQSKTKPVTATSGGAEKTPDPFMDLLASAQKNPEATVLQKEKSGNKDSLSDVVGTAFRKNAREKTEPSGETGNKPNSGRMTQDKKSGGPDILSASFKMFYTLVLVLGIMFLVFHLFKKYVWKNSVFGSESKPIKVLSTGFLGPKKSIALVEVAGEILVLGIANDNISLLANVEDPEQIDLIRGTKSPKTNGRKEALHAPRSGKSRMPSASAGEVENDSVATATMEPPPEKPKQKVDAYESVMKKNKTTNPFPEFVKKFAEESGEDAGALDGLEERLRKTLGRNPGA